MRINFLGDSITAGVGARGLEKSYVSVFERITGHEVRRYGVSGTRIAKQRIPSRVSKWDEDFQKRALEMDKNADFVFVFGGTNDYGHGDAPLGTFDIKDPYTFYGALRCLIEYLIETYGKEKLCFITPLPRYKEDDEKGEKSEKLQAVAPLWKYVEIIGEVAKWYDIGLIDLYNEDFIPVPTSDQGDDYTTDGLHPNAEVHARIAERIASYCQERLGVI